MANCVNINTEEFKELAEQTNLPIPILAAKISLWQDINGEDNFPSLLDIEPEEKIDYLPFTKEGIDEGDFSAFRKAYFPMEELQKGRAVIEEKIEDAVFKNGATSFEIKHNAKGDITQVVVHPQNKGVLGTNNSAKNIINRIKESLDKIINPSYTKNKPVAKLTTVGGSLANTIDIKISREILEAFTRGLQNNHPEDLQQELLKMYWESKGVWYEARVENMRDAKEELAYAKTLASNDFQGFTNAYSGEILTSKDAWIQYLKDLGAEHNQEMEQLDELTIGVNNIVVDPFYDFYEEKRKQQIKYLNTKIEHLENKKVGKDSAEFTEVSNSKVKLTKIRDDFEADLSKYKSTVDKEEILQSFFNKDFELVESLLKDSSVDSFFLAEDIIDFINLNTNFTSSDKGMFRTAPGEKLSPEMDKLVKEIKHTSSQLTNEVDKAREKYFMQILEKYEEGFKKLYPGKSLTEIKNIIMSPLADISAVESFLLPEGINMFSETDIIAKLIRLEYEFKVEELKPAAQSLTKKINAILPSIEKELKRLGYETHIGVGPASLSFIDYNSLFYRKNDKGHLESTMVSKFSKVWDTYRNKTLTDARNAIKEARANKEWSKIEPILKNKYTNLNTFTDFIDYRLLHEIETQLPSSIVDVFTSVKKGTTQEAEDYKQELIKKIGKEEYKNIINRQTIHLQNFLDEKRTLENYYMDKDGVSSLSDLSDSSSLYLKLGIEKINPASFVESHFSGQGNTVHQTTGTQTFTTFSYIKYNTFIPKIETGQGVSTNFYDKEFSKIEQNPILENFYNIFKETLLHVNRNLGDSSLKVQAGTILHLEKSLMESVMDKKFYETVKSLPSKENIQNIGHAIRNLASQRQTQKGNQKEVRLSEHLTSFDNLVNEDYHNMMLDISNILETNLTSKSSLVWTAMTPEQQSSILNSIGVNTEQDFLDEVTLDSKGAFKVSSLKTFSQIAIMQQQTLDLPSLLKAMLEQSTLHRARVEAKSSNDILLRQAEKIKDTKGEVRTNADKRNSYFYNKITLNKNDKEVADWQNVSKRFAKKFEVADLSEKIKMLGKVYYKNFSAEEKRIYDILSKRAEVIEHQLLNNVLDPKLRAELENEKISIGKRITLMGKDYTFSALWSSVVNNLGRTMGLAYNITSSVYNYQNARAALISRDGEFWPQGTAYGAMAFVDMHATRRINPSYAKEWKTMEAFIHQVDLIQDGTNDFQKARKTSVAESPKIYNLRRWVEDPYYATELTEWYNQVPAILCTASTIKIDGPNGPVPLFDGIGFPAHEVDASTGLLKLKDEYRTLQNIEDYETFSSPKMVIWKLHTNNAIASLNGDYSVPGAVRIKDSAIGQGAMMFKTWAGAYYSSRWAYDQKDIVTGTIRDGFVTGTLMNKNTRVLGAVALAGQVAGGLTMMPAATAGIVSLALLGPATMALMAAGIGGGMLLKNRKAVNEAVAQGVPGLLSTTEQLSYILKTLTVGSVEMPVNKIWSFLKLIMTHTTGVKTDKNTLLNIDSSFKGKLNDRETRNLRGLTRMIQKGNMAIIAMYLLKSIMGSDDEEETKGTPGSEQEKRYIAQQEQRRANKGIKNFARNFIQRDYDETMQGVNLMSTYNMFMGDNTTTIDPAMKIAKFAYYMASEEEYVTKKGMYEGDTKSSVAFRKAFVPSLIRNIDKDEWAAGFESPMEDIYIKKIGMDKWSTTDLKKAKEERKKASKDLTTSLKDKTAKELFNKEYKDLNVKEEVDVDRKIKKAIKQTLPTTDRNNFTEDQEIIQH